jgi:16S rRNA processing protein RimM
VQRTPRASELPIGSSGAVPAGAVSVAKVGRPHGVRGEIRLHPESGRPERLDGVTRVWLVASSGEVSEREVASMRVHGDAALVTLEGIDDRDVAAQWTNADAWALASELPAWAEDEFGAGDVIGAQLYRATEGAATSSVGSSDAGETLVGEVTAVVTNAGRDYFEVAHQGRTVLVPAVKDWLVEMDSGGKRIVMRLPEGLLDET